MNWKDKDQLWQPISASADDAIAAPSPLPQNPSRWTALKTRVFDLFYPPACIGCAAALAESEGLCPACWRAMPFIERPFCERLGTPLPVDHGGPLISPAAAAEPPVFNRARAVARYDGLARDCVHRLKYNDRLDLAAPMSRWMARAGRELLDDATLIVPIPLHYRRLWWRRFNQAATLALGISRQTGIPMAFEALKRVKPTRPQFGLTRTERAANLQGAFRINPHDQLILSGARIILVDDVMTTSSTGNVAARTLLKAGAASVDLLVFAAVANMG